MASFEINQHMVCPHCGTKGKVQTRSVKRKAGISGGKAVAGLMTLGVSLITPGIGLSRKERVTEARCALCGAEWAF